MKGVTVPSMVAACLSSSGLVLVAGVGGLDCITSTRGFLMDVSGKQLLGFIFPNRSMGRKQTVQRY